MRVLAIVLLVAVACQPWYRDHERRAREAFDTKRNDRELEAAQKEHAAGTHGRAAQILRGLVTRNPEIEIRVWALLGQYEDAAGRGAEGRAYLGWKMKAATTSSSDAAVLREAIIASFVAEERTAEALALVDPQTLEAASASPSLSAPLKELSAATSSSPLEAIRHLEAWLDSYGEPDHPILRAAVEKVRTSVWDAARDTSGPLALVRQLGPRARAELARGDRFRALALYLQAAHLLPDSQLAPYREEMERAAGADPEAASPVAYALAHEGDQALAAKQLGKAIRAYRRALVLAPWWMDARANLVNLLDAARADTQVVTAFARSLSTADTDSDGLANAVDHCPTEPEDKDKFADDDGCAELDNDGDGYKDAADRCANQPEDDDGFEDDDGCPEPDNDRDDVADAADRCPTSPEDKDGFEDADGCPELDNDRDRLLDAADKCPSEAETWNGTQDDDGCPDKGIVARVDRAFVVSESLAFAKGLATVDAKQTNVLDVVAGALAGNPDVELVEIAVHTSSLEAGGLALSQQRADAIRDYLVGKNIAAAKLVAKGYGDTAPLVACTANAKCQGKCKAACAKNARVAFTIVKP